MPKDNENVLLPDGPSVSSGPQPYSPDQMVSCEKCLRTNPPTRVNCLYCGAVLPITETTVELQRPSLRPLETWERGYNNILLPDSANAQVAEAAVLLKLEPAELARIIACEMPLPLARSASFEEASLVQRRLGDVGITTRIVADEDLGADDGLIRVRAAEFNDDAISAYQTPESSPIRILWSELRLFVVGRLIVKRVEVREKKSSKENQIVSSSEFFSDETAVDFFSQKQPTPFRIMARSFDFSCLKERKGLLAEENMATLLTFFRERAPHAAWDDSYNSARKALDAVWQTEQQNESAGWRRDRPGKLTRGSITETSNETQFLKYSRLRYHFLSSAEPTPDEAR